MAKTSVPSITAPPLIAKPIPAPRKNPPKTATNKLSFVIFGNVKVARANESPPMAKAVFMANCFPITLKPKNAPSYCVRFSFNIQ